MALCVYGDENMWRQVRRDLAETIRVAMVEHADWLFCTDDAAFADPASLADEIENSTGLSGRWGQEQDIRLVGRTYNVNMVIDVEHYNKNSKQMEKACMRFPRRDPDHLDFYNLTGLEFQNWQAEIEESGEAFRPLTVS